MGADHIFNVNCGLVEEHAGTVDTLADELAAARSTADVAMDLHAYGWLCAFLPPILGDTCERGAQAMATATQALTETATTVRGVGARFVAHDTAGAAVTGAHPSPSIPMLNGPVHD
jgi:hypothetical protein